MLGTERANAPIIELIQNYASPLSPLLPSISTPSTLSKTVLDLGGKRMRRRKRIGIRGLRKRKKIPLRSPELTGALA